MLHPTVSAFTVWLNTPDMHGPYLIEPPDGSMILVDEEVVWVRTDEPEAAERAKRQEPGTWVGDWWQLSDYGANDPISLGEVLNCGPHASDDEDKRQRTFEVLYTAADVTRLAKTFFGVTEA